MAIWLDEPVQEPLNGVLVVFNPTGIGDFSEEEREIVEREVKSAIAGGFGVLRIYDKGVDPPPDWMDDIEGHSFGNVPSLMESEKARPPDDAMVDALLNNMPFVGGKVVFMGLYEEDGEVKFLDPTEV